MKMTAQDKELIALVGHALRFPGANSPSELWDLLCEPRDILGDIPPDRMTLKSYYHPEGEHHGTTNVQKSYVISQDHRVFDASFFNISPAEAEAMDPQQRIILEVVYEAIESAGLTIEQLRGSDTSVFLGVMSSDFSATQLRDGDTIPKYAATGTANSILSNRISYFFDWKGPSITIDTACSSSLVALHQAVRSLRSGESQIAVVAGVNLILNPEPYIAESMLHMLSPGSRSRMWDIEADGYARGDGFAAVVLKGVNQAVKDNDNIRSVIRETMVNSDGRTAGITMPSASAQAALIRRTYQLAGLDCRQEADRCQYFEAHGTGTPVGDPIEAEAVRNAFFPEPTGDEAGVNYRPDEQLLIGSIKTVVGHLEGCAGLAGFLKASLAVQKGMIPPNLLFNNLNPKIEPFYTHLKIPTTAQPWPAVSTGQPRRASVNSFGFGGTNAHAIVESYIPESQNFGDQPQSELAQTSWVESKSGGPFVFSASSEASLVQNVKAVYNLLKTGTSIDLDNLSRVLQLRRSVLPVRIAFSGAKRENLVASIDEQLKKHKDSGSKFGVASNRFNHENSLKILGIFTGQGAQWPQMGRELLLSSKVFEETIEDLQKSLSKLHDPPTWCLKAELMAEKDVSRVYEAAIGQPLCAAVQIALIEVLRHAGISFSAVVGHSSGEIAAAYAAGYICSSDAIRIAYYRGCHSMSNSGPAGAMMAVGISFTDALELCQSSQFAGRLCVAASNAPASVTISGDTDAIQEAQQMLGTKHFTRILKVDNAYHSHHMDLAVEPYIRSMKACNVQPLSNSNSCVWISSVTNSVITDTKRLKDIYWADNMTHPVLFSHAIERVLRESGPFDMMIEVGPHPTLEGPVAQTIKAATGSPAPYCALLRRGHNGVETFSNALGYIWAHLGGKASIDFDGYRRTFGDAEMPLDTKILDNLPSYSWDHKRIHWKESRISRNVRFRNDRIHELLGHRRPDDSSHEMRWRNIVRLEEMPWLRGHVFQQQVVFPAAGYISMAVEASKSLWGERPVAFVELHDIVMPRALIIPDNDAGVEVIFALKFLKNKKGKDDMAEFVCSSCPNQTDGNLEVNASGRLRLSFGEPSVTNLASRQSETGYMLPLDIDRFYRSLSDLGLEYNGLFRALQKVERGTSKSISMASWPREAIKTDLIVHPALLDVAFQSAFASIGSTANVWHPYLPTGFERIRVSVLPLTNIGSSGEVNITIDAYTSRISPPSPNSPSTISTDVDISTEGVSHIGIQIEGLSLKAISETNQPSNDRRLFYYELWDVDISTGVGSNYKAKGNALESSELPLLLERLSHVYLRELYAMFSKDEVVTFEWFHQRLWEYMESLFSDIDLGRHPIIKKAWANDTREQVLAELSRFPETTDLRVAMTVAENFPAVLRGEKAMLEVLTEGDMFQRLYDDALGLSRNYSHISRMAKQIAHRYPDIKVCEIGAGTGAATKHVLDSIDGAFSSYVYTDISTGFFEKAAQRFEAHGNKMSFKVFNAERDPEEQGLAPHSFDVVIASSVLHATRRLKETTQNVRRLLRPGGYLLLLEPTADSLRTSFITAGLPGWWLGGDDGRRLVPTVTTMQWDKILRESGFSGIDTLLHDTDEPSKHVYSSIASQALDDRVKLLRDPLLDPIQLPQIEQLLVIGGKTLHVSRLIHQVIGLFRHWEQRTVIFDDFESVNAALVLPSATVLCLTELDRPIFESLSTETLWSMQQLLSKAKQVLWVTKAGRTDNPHSNMTVGLARTLLNEMPHLNLQMMDISGSANAVANFDARILTEALLRLVIKDTLGPEVLWTTEPEIAVEHDGTLLIPRIIPDHHLNARLNSSGRIVQKEVSTAEYTVDVINTNGYYMLQQGTPVIASPAMPLGHTQILVRFSLLRPLFLAGMSSLYLCVGTAFGTGQRVLAASRSNSSVVKTSVEWMYPCEVLPDDEERYLQLVAAEMLAEELLLDVPVGGVLLLHRPEETLARIIFRRAATAGVRVICTTSQLPVPGDDFWIHIQPLAPRREIQKLLPNAIFKFVDFSEGRSDSVCSDIESFLPRFCAIRKIATYFGDEASDVLSHSGPSGLKRSLTAAVSRANATTVAMQDVTIFRNILPDEFVPGVAENSSFCMLDWTGRDFYLTTVKQINPRDLLYEDKTYLLVGMTGDLGVSLGSWMIRNGARNLVLTSRTGVVNPKWLEEARSTGANVKVYSMDVTKKQALRSVHSDICKKMPAIGGVVNAAMVLRDSLFVDMSFEEMADVLGPKVEGTENLNDLFDGVSLDFFVMLSSVSAIAGYPGQSNYAAANMFMAGVTHQRRKNGLTASVIDLGMLAEVGYVSRSGKNLEEYLRKKNHCLSISEAEFHHIFAEAIVAGRPDSGQCPELLVGLAVSRYLDDERPPWFYNPRFSHCRPKDDDDVQEGVAVVAQISQQLAGAASAEEANEILQKAFIMKLAKMLQISESDIFPRAPLMQLGIDSLVAIEIRSWFIKETKIDIPVMKVLSGSSAAELCEEVVEKLFASREKGGSGDETAVGEKELPTSALAIGPGTPAMDSDGKEAKDIEDRSDNASSDSGLDVNVSNGLAAEQTENVGSNKNHDNGTMQQDPILEVESKSGAVSALEEAMGKPSSLDTVSANAKTSEESGFGREAQMSYAQSRLWFLKAYSDNPSTYNVVLAYDIKGPTQIARLKKAFRTVISRHEIFRTRFFMHPESGEGMQSVLEEPSVALEEKEITSDADVVEEIDRIRSYVFDLEKGNTCLATLLRRSSSWSTMVFGYHHILMDGSSFFLFLRELTQAYEMRPLNPDVAHYFDYATSQRNRVKSGQLADEITFWKKEFPDLPPTLPLFGFSRVRSRSVTNVYGTHTAHSELSPQQAWRMKKASQELGITPFHFHLTVLQALLFKLLSTDEVCIGIADANRTERKFLNTIGVFLNILPLRFQRHRSEELLSNIAKTTAQKALAALANSRLPFEALLDELNVPRSQSHTPLFQVLVNYRMGTLPQAALGESEIRPRGVNDAILPYDLYMSVTEPTKETCYLSISMRDDLYSADACNILMKSYIHLLHEISESPLQTLDTYNLYSNLDARLGISLVAGQRMPTSFQSTLSCHVDAVAERQGDDIAVKDGYGNILTYTQLTQRSYTIAGALSAAGVTVGSYVAVLMEPSSDSIASLLAISRLGAIYTPLDVQNAPARLAVISQNCQPSAVICQPDTLHLARNLGVEGSPIINVSCLAATYGSVSTVEDRSEMGLPAFALYTSGSTGSPKGILLTQTNLLNAMSGTLEDQYTGGGKEVVLQQSSLGFDLSLYQIFRALLGGGKLIVAPRTIRVQAKKLAELMLDEKITFTLATPTEYSILLQYGDLHLKRCSNWKLAWSAGENMTLHLQRQFQQLGLTTLSLMDCFGPTELGIFTKTDVCYTNIQSGTGHEYPTIGRPLPNISVFILDEQLRPVPTGFPGEICVSGANNSLGYINNLKLTESKFVKNPFASSEDAALGWTKLYRSGDKGRMLEDGSIVFLGRMDGDSQIKLRGFRIELDDIANTILDAARGCLADATLSVRGDPQFLVAFVVFSSGSTPSNPARFLKELLFNLPLPSYMMPAMMVPVERIPTNANGKKDRDAIDTLQLPAMDISQEAADLTTTESKLKSLWREILQSSVTETVQINHETGFFHLGGNSILVMKLQASIWEAFQVDVGLAELFQYDALRSMAARIDVKKNKTEEERLAEKASTESLHDAIDWEAETAVSDELLRIQYFEASEPPSKGKVVLLTGSTEFFGRTLLRMLVEDDTVAKVHCIAVPKVDEFSPVNNTPDYAKVETHVGSVMMPNLGLSEADISKLSREVHVIVHAGVSGSLLNSYQSIRERSVTFTKQLVKIAAPRRIPIHLISSGRVVPFSGKTSLEEASVGQWPPPTDGSEGLAAAKWACERYLEKVSEKLRLPVCIHRACAAVSESAPATDVINSILKYSRVLKAVPILENAQGFIDYAPADVIADGILRELKRKVPASSCEENLLSFVHHTSGHSVAPKELKDHFEAEEGCPFEELPVAEWTVRAKQIGVSEFVTATLDAIGSRKGPIYLLPLLLKAQ